MVKSDKIGICRLLTVANLSTYSSGAPKEAKPISWLNWANSGSANKGTCPINSWQTSGSGVYIGLLGWRMYWVEWNTRNAKPAKKSRDDSRPATGRKVKPVLSKNVNNRSIIRSIII